MVFFFEAGFHMLNSDLIPLLSVLGADNDATSTGADDFLNLICILDKVPFFGQS